MSGDFVMSHDRESTVEDEVVAWAENNGWMSRFMSYRGRRGCPDNWFFGFGHIVIIEFKKAEGGELSANQIRERKRLADQGITIYVIDTFEDGVALLQGFMPC